jgi:hypothetical protein
MARRRRDLPLARFGVLALCVSACGGADDAACIIPPCALPFAVQLTVTDSASLGPVPGATVAIAGAESGQAPCNVAPGATCMIPGPAGTYELDISAPGYRSVHRQVVVTGTSPACGCGTVDTQRLTVALVRAG